MALAPVIENDRDRNPGTMPKKTFRLCHQSIGSGLPLAGR